MNKEVYKYFKEISDIPRGTYNIDEISNYLVSFAKKRDLEVYQDEVKNVIIKKKASKGYENKESVILQAHMDMVCQKEADSNHDFLKDPITIIEKDGFLTADKTTLGADNGIGVAMILAILDSSISLPKIEALITVNEEIGMEGALNIDMNLFDSNMLINIDSEDEGILTAGCAGGVGLEVFYKGNKEKKKGNILDISLSNLKGGHSGVDINKNRVNAIKCVFKFIKDIKGNIVSVNAGKVDNAIPDSINLKYMLDENIDIDTIKDNITSYLNDNKEENAIVNIKTYEDEVEVLSDSKDIISYVNECINGVISYEEGLDDMVRTSLNLGVIETDDDKILFKHLIRSSSDEEKEDVVNNIKASASKINAIVKEVNPYSGWEFKKDSKLRERMSKIYKDMFNKDLIINTIHAGLECGMFVSKKPTLDCVSIGPNVYDVHTPNERLDIESTNRTYEYIINILQEI